MKYMIDFLIFFAMAGLYTTVTVREEYLYQRISEKYHFTENSSTEYCTPNKTNTSYESDAIASEVSRFTIYINTCVGILGIFSSILLCSWSDHIGRKIPLAINISGLLAASLLQICVIVYRLPLSTLITTGTILGVSGYFVTLLNLSMAYLSDIVTPKEKSFRFTVLECTMGVGGGITSFATGFWIKSQGFIPTSILASVCLFGALLLVIFLKNTKEDEHSEDSDACVNKNESTKDNTYGATPGTRVLSTDRESRATFVSRMKRIWRIYTSEKSVCYCCNIDNQSMVCKHGGGLRRGRVWRIWFYVVAFTFKVYQEFGVSSFLNMYLLGYPLCFTPILLGAFTGMRFGSLGLGPLVLKFNQKFVHLSDQSIIVLSILTQIVVVSINAVARSATLMFISISFSVFGSLLSPLIRSQISSLVSTSEQGSALSLISSTEVFTSTIASISFLLLYPVTLDLYHGFIWLYCDMILLIPLFLMGSMWITNKMSQNSTASFHAEEKDPLI